MVLMKRPTRKRMQASRKHFSKNSSSLTTSYSCKNLGGTIFKELNLSVLENNVKILYISSVYIMVFGTMDTYICICS
jgi:hypothetical protein